MAHGDAQEGKLRGNWRMEWVASTLHASSEHGVSSITTADAHTSSASSRLNWRPCRFKWTRPFRRKTKSGFCACAITFQTQSTVGRVQHLWRARGSEIPTRKTLRFEGYWLLSVQCPVTFFSAFRCTRFRVELKSTRYLECLMLIPLSCCYIVATFDLLNITHFL